MQDLSQDAYNVSFGKALRRFRENRALSQETLAAQSKLDRTYISLLERNLRQPTLRTMTRLAQALGITFSEFAGAIEEGVHDH